MQLKLLYILTHHPKQLSVGKRNNTMVILILMKLKHKIVIPSSGVTVPQFMEEEEREGKNDPSSIQRIKELLHFIMCEIALAKNYHLTQLRTKKQSEHMQMKMQHLLMIVS
jgi:hypothetical protein